MLSMPYRDSFATCRDDAAASGGATPLAAGIERQPDIETSSDAYAVRFSGKVGAYFLARQEQLVLGELKGLPGGSLLDVGGGHAQLSGPLADAGWDVTILGSAPSCAARLALDPRNDPVEFVAGDLLGLPFPNQSFDVAVSVRTMAHIEDWPRFIGELCRVARRAVVIDYPELLSLNLLSGLTFGLKHRVEGDTRHFRSFRASEIAREFDRNGFAVMASRRQFFLPMAIHRAAKGAAALRLIERAMSAIGVTDRFGNPGILRADRQSGRDGAR